MYETIWNLIRKNIPSKNTAYILFILALSIGFALVGLAFGIAVTIILSLAGLIRATVIFCCAGYAGLILGFFGGLMCLY